MFSDFHRYPATLFAMDPDFPIGEDEIRELFTEICVDSVHIIQDNFPGDEQPLFARMVLRSVTNVDQFFEREKCS
ncbi:hypothetical protein V6N11_056491 [Hibiscus sabdariffa]|uniref:Uncharacterized protein n=1 Tax=Hibiscus sabdariffa TaxID=183260 RepID=A0ABR2T3Z4_9ROSI